MADQTSNPHFRFRVSDFGRIAEADIELRPLTLLVGENNSGKSYLATLIWALHQVPKSVFGPSKAPAWLEAERRFREVVKPVDVDEAERSRRLHLLLSGESEAAAVGAVDLGLEWRGWADELLRSYLPGHLSKVFRTRDLDPHLECVASTHCVFGFAARDGDTLTWHAGSQRTRTSMGEMNQTLASRVVQEALDLSASLPSRRLGSYSDDLSAVSTHLYFPASRTGYLQLLPDVLDRLLGDALNRDGDPPLQGLTAPSVQFLRFLLGGGHAYGDLNQALADLIEKRVLGGQIRREEGQKGRFLFRPDRTNIDVPMGRASAVVMELIPLLTALRTWSGRLLVYEEPENDLHPRLQRIVARVLVRLVRQGVTVIVTTHSTTMAQQFNNAIKLGGLSPELRARLPAPPDFEPYSDADCLAVDDVAAYGFRFLDDGRSTADRLEVTGGGVVMPSFNDELADLIREVNLLDEAAD